MFLPFRSKSGTMNTKSPAPFHFSPASQDIFIHPLLSSLVYEGKKPLRGQMQIWGCRLRFGTQIQTNNNLLELDGPA